MQGITFLSLTTMKPPKLSIFGKGFALPAWLFAEAVAETGGDRAVTPLCKQKQNLSCPWSTQTFALWALLFSVQVVLFPVVSVLLLRQFHEPPVSPRACFRGRCLL